MLNAQSLASLAISMKLSPNAAIALSSVIHVSAKKVNMKPSEMLWRAHNDRVLQEYLAEVCESIAPRVPELLA